MSVKHSRRHSPKAKTVFIQLRCRIEGRKCLWHQDARECKIATSAFKTWKTRGKGKNRVHEATLSNLKKKKHVAPGCERMQKSPHPATKDGGSSQKANFDLGRLRCRVEANEGNAFRTRMQENASIAMSVKHSRRHSPKAKACGTRMRENAKIATSATRHKRHGEKAKTEFIQLRCRI
jgi:hypothetical protein